MKNEDKNSRAEIKSFGSVKSKTKRILFCYPKIHRPENTDAFEKLKGIVNAFFVIEKVIFGKVTFIGKERKIYKW